MDSSDLLASPFNTLSILSIRIVLLNVVFEWTIILKFSMNSGQQFGFLSNVNSSIGDKFFASICWCTALKTVISSLELVSKIVSCSSTNRSINKSTGSICCYEIDKSEDLWATTEFVGCFGFDGNFGSILLSLLCVLLAFLILSVMWWLN